MRYFVTIVWGALLGEVVGFLVSALAGNTFDPKTSLIVGLVFAVLLFLLPPTMAYFDPETSKSKKA
ncbi:YjzD family protein [Lacticaseibacillus parakribbianus]|uniref:YjzD family protein n=1 Tax=Lacticaseibacillus parakribbianus TaxID=2970927 RepID=UPI0021CB7C06|nr:YjzD family protein [Lacticaseibacillus parakribbianus]